MKITLNPDERELILKYGYPSPALERRLQKLRGADRDAQLTVEDFEPRQIAGDLSISMNEGKIPDRDLEEVDALCEYLEDL